MSDVKTNSQSCFENEWLRAKIFTPATFPVFLGAFTKTNETISVQVCTHTTPATNGNLRELCLITVSYVILFVIVKLQTDNLAMAAENSLNDKNQRYKIKQGW